MTRPNSMIFIIIILSVIYTRLFLQTLILWLEKYTIKMDRLCPLKSSLATRTTRGDRRLYWRPANPPAKNSIGECVVYNITNKRFKFYRDCSDRTSFAM